MPVGGVFLHIVAPPTYRFVTDAAKLAMLN